MAERRAGRRFWRIRGHEKLDTVFDMTVPTGCLTHEQLKDLLRCLSAKANASFEDIVGAYVKRKTKLAHEFLEPQSSFPETGYWCAGDVQFVAILVDEKGDRIKSPPLPRPNVKVFV